MTTVTPRLPEQDDVGREADWTLPVEDASVSFHGIFLGMASSHRDRHNHDGMYASRTDGKCSACRWFEPRIFRESAGRERFLIHHTGRSIVPHETDRTRAEWVLTATEVVEALATRRHGERVRLTVPAARVLAQASEHDDDLYDAYRDRIAQVG